MHLHPAQSEILRTYLKAPDYSIGCLVDHGNVAERNLIEPVLPSDNPGALRAESCKSPGEFFARRFVRDTNHLKRSSGRICQRPQKVEYRSNSDVATDGSHTLCRFVMKRREHEADTDLIEDVAHPDRRQIDVDSKYPQNVGAASFCRHTDISMLGHWNTGRGDNENCGLCADCFDLATIQNGLWDNGGEYLKESGYDAKVRAIFARRPELIAEFTELHEAVK